jgi:phenylacetate-CoA ligase
MAVLQPPSVSTGAQAIEQASRDELRDYQLRCLNAMLSELLPSNRFYRAKLGSALVLDRLDELVDLPLTSKSELVLDHAEHPPFGTNLTYPLARYSKLHQTSGTMGRPMRWLDTPESWEWWTHCWSYVYRAAGIGPGDRVYFAFSFGPFIGFWAAYEAAPRVGALTIPGGGLSTEQRLQQLLETGATVLCCTPTYALRLAEVASATGVDLAASDVRVTIHAGEPGASIPATRTLIEAAFGARCYDHPGMTELGASGFTCQHHAGVHLIESEFIAEVLDPATSRPLEAGGRGELVMTNLGRVGSPVIRYRTGDLVELELAPCACGRTFARLRGGIVGRVDDMLVVRGINIYPSSIEAIVRGFPEIAEFRIELLQRHAMGDLRVVVERAPNLSAEEGVALAGRLSEELHRQLALRVDCSCVEPDALPRFELKARRVVRLSD